MKKLVFVTMVIFLLMLAVSSVAKAQDVGDKDWAKKQVKFAKTQRSILVGYTDALGKEKPRAVPTISRFTSKEASTTVTVRDWDALGKAAKNKGLYWKKVRIPKLHRRITHPGGSSNGKRWIPLARYVGWPEYALRNLSALIMNESSGRQRAVSYTNDHGLVQFNAPSWATTWARKMKCPFFPNVYNPELNLRFAYYVFHVVQHNSFLPAWRGDPAATF